MLDMLDPGRWGLPEDPKLLIALVGACASMLSLASIWMALTPRNPGVAKARTIAERRSALKRQVVQGNRRRSDRALGFMTAVVRRLNLIGTDYAVSLSGQLARAGLRQRRTLIAVLFCKLVAPPAGIVVAVILADFMGYPPTQPLHWAGLVLVGLALGYYAPDVYVRNLADRRAEQLRLGIPDALDLLVICAEAGLSLDQSMTRVSREMARSAPEVSDELALTAVELGFLPNRKDALENLRERTALPAIRALVNTLMQTEKFGTPLAGALRVLSSELREERLSKAEEKAARLPVMLTVPMILFIMPPLFVVLIGPGILRVMDGFSGL